MRWTVEVQRIDESGPGVDVLEREVFEDARGHDHYVIAKVTQYMDDDHIQIVGPGYVTYQPISV